MFQETSLVRDFCLLGSSCAQLSLPRRRRGHHVAGGMVVSL